MIIDLNFVSYKFEKNKKDTKYEKINLIINDSAKNRYDMNER